MMLLVKLVKFSMRYNSSTLDSIVVRLFSTDRGIFLGGRKIEAREIVGLIRWKKGWEGNGRRERQVDGRAGFNTVAASSSFGNEFCLASV